MILYLHCLCITLICVFIVDIFNAIGEISKSIFSLLTRNKINAPIRGKIFYCSCCLSWWLSLIYLVYMNALTIPNVLYILVLSFCTTILKSVILVIEEKIINLINKL